MVNIANQQPTDDNPLVTLLDWIQIDPNLTLAQKLEFAYKQGYTTGRKNEETYNSILISKPRQVWPEIKLSRFANVKATIHQRRRTILIVAVLTTAINYFVIPHYTYHTYKGGWSRLNTWTGALEHYFQGHWQTDN